MGGRIDWSPAVPDGVDCPWTRGRPTRWWLVLPADAVGAVMVAVLGAAGAHELDAIPMALAQGAIAVVIAWVCAWALLRGREHHLERPWPEGGAIVAVAWGAWTVMRILAVGGAGLASWAVMTGVLLVAVLGGWRWLYGFAKAHESLIPKPIQRRLDVQDQSSSA
ncbi:hypothetical protein [Actinomyces gaoshouyii]|uniref:hypothetical protein n=1 Tax=Actinomyces gaoshouyii TaxID=1960083 RepID=UPI0009BF605C|nr:hypothetical protein [Actinomyces gaoshouyii]ARD42695.1 hypothetical protein B6G06_02865 [Actinomyces gaoshouyii]